MVRLSTSDVATTACNSLKARNASTLVENSAPMDARIKIAIEASVTGRRPTLSEIGPMKIWSTAAKRSTYSTRQSRQAVSASRYGAGWCGLKIAHAALWSCPRPMPLRGVCLWFVTLGNLAAFVPTAAKETCHGYPARASNPS